MRPSPLVTVLVAVADGERTLRPALASVLRQTLAELELLVVDDASTDSTPEILAGIDDARLRVVRNELRSGLATSLNRGLEEARGRYVARLDADDVAFPDRLEKQLAAMRSRSLAVLGSAVLDLEGGRPGRLHLMPASPAAVRWAALFGSPFFHPSVLLDAAALERHSLRYDPELLESEDYDLWTRLLAHEDGSNLAEPLVLYGLHEGQASRARRDLQRHFQRQVALREIARVAPGLSPERAELAWQVGVGEHVSAAELADAAGSFVELLRSFEASLQQTGTRSELRDVRSAGARALVRAAAAAGLPGGSDAARALSSAARLDPFLPAHVGSRRAARRRAERQGRTRGERWLRALESPSGEPPARVVAVFPEPTPYRAPLLDLVAARPEIDLTVLYAAETVAGRTWSVAPRHPALFLRGLRVPGAARVLRHDYPLTPGIARALASARPDVVVASGWSTFAAQAAIAWARARHVPYLLVVESHDEDPRPGWRRAIKGWVVPPLVRGAAGVLVTGSLARRSMVARGARPERVRVLANTIDVEAFGAQAAALAHRRDELRTELGAGADDVVVLSVARLVPDKRHDLLVQAVAETGDPRLLLVLAGEGPERERLETLAREVDARLVLAGDRPWERIVEAYVAADVFALLSEREPWGVVVNEAAACGLPLVLSDRVGAAHDLLRDGENGMLVPAGDAAAAAAALRGLVKDPALRAAYGARSRELVAGWGYGPSVEGFVAAVREAVSDTA